MNQHEQIEVMKTLGQQAAAWLVGISPRSFRDRGAPRNENGSYNAADIYAWSQASAVNEDPLLADGDSPNLERYRAAKADLVEMDLAERRGQLLHVDELSQWFSSEVAPAIRQGVDKLKRQFGPEAAAIIDNAIETAANAVDEKVTP